MFEAVGMTSKILPGTLVSPVPLPLKKGAVTLPVKLGLLLSNTTFVESRASGSVPVRLGAGTLKSPAPLPLNWVAVTLDKKNAFVFSSATFGGSTDAGSIPVKLVAGRVPRRLEALP